MIEITDFISRNLLIGRFCFKKTQNGNLIGEFSHSGSILNSTESADIDGYNEGFRGSYYSTWQENKIMHSADLRIDFKTDTNERIYKLTWTENGKDLFLGEGFIFDDMLIGDYRNFNIS